MKSRTLQNGSALIVCMVVLVVCSALAVGFAAISGANVQIADNQRGANLHRLANPTLPLPYCLMSIPRDNLAAM